MLTIRYFASLREAMGCDHQQLPWQPAWQTVAHIKNHLAEQPSWQAFIAMGTPILTAVNQAMVDDNHKITDGDEIAFFPPVTGG